MMRDMRMMRSKRWLHVLGAAALVLSACASVGAQELSRAAVSDSAQSKKWDATAPGRVEPASGEITISALAPGRIAQVLVAPNDNVFAGELLVRLDDEEMQARLAEAKAQVIMRQRARDDETKKGSADRRRAGDAVAEAEQALADAQAKLDQAVEAARNAHRSPIEDSAVAAARAALSKAQDELRKRRDAFSSIELALGLPTFPESEIQLARVNLSLARIALDRSRVRAAIDGRVLQVNARAGEVASAAQQRPLVVLGDVSSLRIRAELDERDLTKVKVGQTVSVRANAFKDQTFAGKVARIAQFVGPSRMNAQPSRGKLNDVDVVEVMVDLTDPGPLTVGMQADVYFQRQDGERSSSK
jgi:HlyD family secretion protein